MAEGLAVRRVARGAWFVALWALAAALAVSVGRVVGGYLYDILAYPAVMLAVVFVSPRANLDGFELAELAGYVTSMVGISLTTGLAQWLVLRGHLRSPRWWWPATSVGLTLGALLDLGLWSRLWSLLGEFATQLPTIHIHGVVLGGVQWLLLRQMAGAGWWIPASGVGWHLGFLARGVIFGLAPETTATPALSSLAFGGAAGLVTGATLLWLLRSSPQTQNA